MPPPDANRDVRAAVELGIKAATAYQREDLVGRLQNVLVEVNRPETHVVVIGEFKQGKSSLVNAVVGAAICPVDDDIATAVPTVLRYGAESKAFALIDGHGDAAGTVVRQPIALDQIRSYATEAGGIEPGVVVKGVEIDLPRRLLQDGVVVIDTPGVGGLGSAHAAAGLGALSLADAALFVTDASQELTRAEMDFLAQAREVCPKVACVLTKVDLYPRWREVLKINQGHLTRAGMNIPILAVSSVLRVEANARDDNELREQSGFGPLFRYLAEEVVAANANRIRTAAQADLFSVCDQVAGQFEAEKAVLNDPQANAELVADLEATKARAESLNSQVARWNVTLNDGITDLSAAVDFDLRTRIRQLMAEADTAIDQFDPLDSWDEFEPWLTNAVSQAVVANYRLLTEHSSALTNSVSAHFNTGESQLMAQLDIHNAAHVLERVKVDPSIEVEGTSVASKGLTALRGGYSGVLMTLFLGNLGLLAAVSGAVPFVGIAMGIGLGRKSLKEEKERAMAKRRSEAKNAVRRYADEVSFQVGNDSKNTLRAIQRQLRDHYGDRAKELTRSTNEALKSASGAAKVAESDRARKLRDVERELERIAALRKQTVALVPAGASGARGAGA